MERVDIEQIVREVVKRLTQRERGAASPIAHEPSTLVIPDRVVTTHLIQGRLQGVRVVQVRADAVIPTSVRDELKEAAVELTRHVPSATSAKVVNLFVDDSPWSVEEIVQRLSTAGIDHQPVSDWNSLVSRLELEAEPTVVFTTQWAARVCCANQRGVAAAVVDNVDQLVAAQSQLSLRMVVVDSSRHGLDGAVEIARAFGKSAGGSDA